MSYKDVLVSVNVPVYNVKPYLERAIDSILAQTHENIEVVCLYGPSSDGSTELLFELAKKDSRLKLFKQEGKGLGNARNEGLRYSTGDWLCFVDPDDWIEPTYVEALLASALDYDVLAATVNKVMNEEARYVNHGKVTVLDFDDYYAFRRSQWDKGVFTVWRYMFAKSLFAELDFSEKTFGEDRGITPLLLYKAGKVAYSNQYLYHQCQRTDSLEAESHDSSYSREMFDSLPPVLDFLKDKNCDKARFVIYRQMVQDFVRYGLTNFLAKDVENMGFVIDKLREYHEEIVFSDNSWLETSVGSKQIWERLQSGKEKLVLCGYGGEGHRVLSWLKHFGIAVAEIWDENAPAGGGEIDGVPYRARHGGLSSADVLILSALENEGLAMEAHYALQKLGYSKFCYYRALNGAMNYGIAKTYASFLMGD
ncbi:MAG: glycosyltransferase family 2 protein [Lachnospiraceae bacterium]|jgi:glycosyltransferase involved in cell wall biosynthesis|nr:glycosyltransferase family 2 protein [Lachnospiraceae bacterium]